jgi:molybdate transport system substrate-binding protein
MTTRLTGISSMATRLLLAELADAYRHWDGNDLGIEVAFEAVGGVDAARRVQAGEPFDLVVLASAAIDKLIDSGRLVADSKTDLVSSQVAIAVRAGAPRPGIETEEALRAAVLAARSIGYSTGPSGTALTALFARWGIRETIQDRIVQAPPGVAVGQLVAGGEVELGFQQHSELLHLPGIYLLGTMPRGCEILTIFSAGLCVTSRQPGPVRNLLHFMQSPAADKAKRRQGMEPA